MQRLFYIDYPQEHYEGQLHRYRCIYCKEETTKINGNLEGHLPSCNYRIFLEEAGFELENLGVHAEINTSDNED